MRHTSRQRRAAVTPSASSLRSVVAPVRWSAVGPGGGVCGAVARTKRRSANPRRRRRSSTPLRCVPSRRRPPSQPRPSAAPGRVPGSPQPPPKRGSRFAWCRAAGRRSRSRWSPCGSGRFAPCGPVRMAGRSRETARLGFACSAARSPTNTSRWNACTDAAGIAPP